ncbi:hypothetical protein D081_1321 [Anaerovibrio sp. JC8]|uniref:hypothetical protein n=1 Tax=Anaerovibrio sp. JC8 TaxID=1240085 RepID=UPI000A09DF41|nr:hypothetical protein [Anaerovibrio sp. JC8]ORU00227.1 hypothetical protein D081_1321 [Anaerovibrio sp. JC8]
MTQNEWVLKQMASLKNLLSVGTLLLFMMYILAFSESNVPVIVFFVCFFLATAWRMLAMMLFFSLIAFGLVTLLPFLAPIAFIIMLVLFLARIGFVLKNWRAVVSGLLVYGLAYCLYDEKFYYFVNPMYDIAYYILNFFSRSLVCQSPGQSFLSVLLGLPVCLHHCLSVSVTFILAVPQRLYSYRGIKHYGQHSFGDYCPDSALP